MFRLLSAQGYTPPNATQSEYQSVPLSKIEDFGAHANRYYPLEISHFKSSLDTKLLDLLWNKYWVMTLSQSPLISNRAYTTSQVEDLTHKLSKTESSLNSRASLAYLAPEAAATKSNVSKGKEKAAAGSAAVAEKEEGKKEETAIQKAVRDRWVFEHYLSVILIQDVPGPTATRLPANVSMVCSVKCSRTLSST